MVAREWSRSAGKERAPVSNREPPSILDVLSGKSTGVGPAALRAALAVLELPYAGLMSVRNALYDHRILRARRLPRPVISVGNITTGGTGKTPVVRWLATRLREAGRRPAILLRGYRSTNGVSDEQTLLDQNLNGPDLAPIYVAANPDRVAAATQLFKHHPEIDVFLLDDAMQNRRVARDFNLILVSATEPFGYGHVLPRGLLREPLSGLRRADAILITHAGEVPRDTLATIESEIRRRNPNAPMFHCDHVHSEIRSDDESFILDELRTRRFYAFCGIGNPNSFDQQLRSLGGGYVGSRWFGDHHAFSPADLRDVNETAIAAGANILVTTEKDWPRIEPLAGMIESLLPVWRIRLELRFWDADEPNLLEIIRARIAPTSAPLQR